VSRFDNRPIARYELHILLRVIHCGRSRPLSTENVVHPPSSPHEERIGLLGVFAAPGVESAFRQQRFRDDRWLSEFLVTAGMLRVAFFVLADYGSLDIGSTLWLLLAGRVLFVLVSAWVFVALRRCTSARLAERLFFRWGLFIVAMTVCALSAQPPGNRALLFMSFSMVLVSYCVAPLPLLLQATLALIYSAGALYVARHADGTTLAIVAAVHGMAHVFGTIASWRLNHRRRELFLGSLREAKLRASLEAAMAEVRTLRGLLCMCAWCKRIRDNEAWESLEVYVRNRTDASFSHGICPDCLQSQKAELARLRG
jgi:hypothetical protein